MQLPFTHDLSELEPVVPIARRVNARARYTGAGVTIAYLDSGFYPHPDLVTPLSRVKAYADATGEQVIERALSKSQHASNWHGTMTAGASAGNGVLSGGRYRGIASRASLVLVKTGQPDTFRISEKDIGRALSWVIEHHARLDVRVVNISLGGDVPSKGKATALDKLVEEAVSLGMCVVCAAGNSGLHKIIPPASAAAAITVGGLNDFNGADRARQRLYHSSYGAGVGGAMKPELIAPAQFVPAPMLPDSETHKLAQLLWTLEKASDRALLVLLKAQDAQDALGMEVQKPLAHVRRAVRHRINEQKFIHPHYQHSDGTSFAAPIVSAVIAQMLEANPKLTPAQVKHALIDTADALDDVAVERQGAGVVNASAAVRAGLGMTRSSGRRSLR